MKAVICLAVVGVVLLLGCDREERDPRPNARRDADEQAVAVTDARRQAVRTSPAITTAQASTVAVGCSYFVLDVLNLAETPVTGDTAFATFHALTVKSGSIAVACGGETVRLNTFDTAIVAASAGTYAMHALEESAAVLRARVPDR